MAKDYTIYLQVNEEQATQDKKQYIKVELTTIEKSINYIYGGYNSKGVYLSTRIVTQENRGNYTSECFNLIDSGYKYKLMDIKRISKNMYKKALQENSDIIDILKSIIKRLQTENSLSINENTYNQFIGDFTSLITSILEG